MSNDTNTKTSTHRRVFSQSTRFSFAPFAKGIQERREISYNHDDAPGDDPRKQDGRGDARKGYEEDVEQVADIIAVASVAAVPIVTLV